MSELKKYNVTFSYVVHHTLEVEAESEDEALDLGYEEAGLTGFCGNGGTDRLVGVYEGSLEFDDYPLEEDSYKPRVEEV